MVSKRKKNVGGSAKVAHITTGAARKNDLARKTKGGLAGERAANTMNIKLNKKLGQHLLKNTGVLEKIIAAAEIKSVDTVLEIGPGTGNLTLKLTPIARRVVALDIDERMVIEVKKRAMRSGFSNLEARFGDALRSDLGTFDVCVANMPYQISSPFIFKLLAHRPLWRCAVLMFQKEFAERLLAKPGDKVYSRLSLNTQLFCRVDRVCLVKAGSFNPPPKVDSMVVRLVPRKPMPQLDFREWDGMLRICFLRKARMLRGNFGTKAALKLLEANYRVFLEAANKPVFVGDFKKLVLSILEGLNLADRRAITVSMDEYFQLLLAFNQSGIHFRNIAVSGGMALPNSSEHGSDAFAGLGPDFHLKMEDDEINDDDDEME